MSNQNVYDTANQLEREIRQLPEVAAIRQALAGIEADETSKTLFESYKKQVQELSLREAQGHPIGEEEMKQIDELSKGIMADDHIRGLIEAERRMDQIIRDLNKKSINNKPKHRLAPTGSPSLT